MFDLLICCHVSITGKGNGTEEEWEEKRQQGNKKKQISLGTVRNILGCLLTVICCGGL